jgi:hypothetical protein
VKLARLSALTGILFAALFVLALVFVYTTPHLSVSDADITAFYNSGSTVLVTVGQTLVPLAGIAFLWHAHTTRFPGGRAHFSHLGRGRRPGGLHPRRSCSPTGRI